MLQSTLSSIRQTFARWIPVKIESGPAFPIASFAERIHAHLDDCALVREQCAGLHVPWQSTPAAQRLQSQAASIAVELAALPGYRGNPVLSEAHERLARYWRSRWSSGGVSDVAYRVALKTVLVYLNQLSDNALPCAGSRDAARAA
jgi:hypothetical protein